MREKESILEIPFLSSVWSSDKPTQVQRLSDQGWWTDHELIFKDLSLSKFADLVFINWLSVSLPPRWKSDRGEILSHEREVIVEIGTGRWIFRLFVLRAFTSFRVAREYAEWREYRFICRPPSRSSIHSEEPLWFSPVWIDQLFTSVSLFPPLTFVPRKNSSSHCDLE